MTTYVDSNTTSAFTVPHYIMNNNTKNDSIKAFPYIYPITIYNHSYTIQINSTPMKE